VPHNPWQITMPQWARSVGTELAMQADRTGAPDGRGVPSSVSGHRSLQNFACAAYSGRQQSLTSESLHVGFDSEPAGFVSAFTHHPPFVVSQW
jgi:hypothetical protein